MTYSDAFSYVQLKFTFKLNATDRLVWVWGSIDTMPHFILVKRKKIENFVLYIFSPSFYLPLWLFFVYIILLFPGRLPMLPAFMYSAQKLQEMKKGIMLPHTTNPQVFSIFSQVQCLSTNLFSPPKCVLSVTRLWLLQQNRVQSTLQQKCSAPSRNGPIYIQLQSIKWINEYGARMQSWKVNDSKCRQAEMIHF